MVLNTIYVLRTVCMPVTTLWITGESLSGALAGSSTFCHINSIRNQTPGPLRLAPANRSLQQRGSKRDCTCSCQGFCSACVCVCVFVCVCLVVDNLQRLRADVCGRKTIETLKLTGPQCNSCMPCCRKRFRDTRSLVFSFWFPRAPRIQVIQERVVVMAMVVVEY